MSYGMSPRPHTAHTHHTSGVQQVAKKRRLENPATDFCSRRNSLLLSELFQPEFHVERVASGLCCECALHWIHNCMHYIFSPHGNNRLLLTGARNESSDSVPFPRRAKITVVIVLRPLSEGSVSRILVSPPKNLPLCCPPCR